MQFYKKCIVFLDNDYMECWQSGLLRLLAKQITLLWVHRFKSYTFRHAPIAQLDRASGFYPLGWEFESLWARQFIYTLLARMPRQPII